MANYGKHENVAIIKCLSGASKWNFKRVYFISRLTGGEHNNRARFARVAWATRNLFLAIDKVLYSSTDERKQHKYKQKSSSESLVSVLWYFNSK